MRSYKCVLCLFVGSKYTETCTPQLLCFNNMLCVSGRCDCENPGTQYHDPLDDSCKASKYLIKIQIKSYKQINING